MKCSLFFAFVMVFLVALAGPYLIYLDGDRTYDNLALGIPSAADQIIDREGYALGFSQKWKQPLWVIYRLTKEEVLSDVAPRSNNFTSDPCIIGGSVTPSDYLRSGYDRGHLAPAADMHWSTNVMNESFYMSNMSPQTPVLNRDLWKRAEMFARDCAIKEEAIYIVSGPIVTNETPSTIGDSKVVVPDLFYKVIYDITPPEKMMSFIMPNGNETGDIWSYATNVVYVEEITGVKFFSAVDTNVLQQLKVDFNKLDWIE